MRNRPGADDLARVVARRRHHQPLPPASPRHATSAPWLADYAFTIHSDADREALLDAEVLAGQWGVPFLQALFADDRISEDRFARDLAAALGVPFAAADICLPDRVPALWARAVPIDIDTAIRGHWRGTPVLILCATSAAPAAVMRRVAATRLHMTGQLVVLVTGRVLSAAAERARATAHIRVATSALKRRWPRFSAGRPGPLWQPMLLATVVALIAAGLIADRGNAVALLTALLTLSFTGTLLVRLMALIGQVRASGAGRHAVPPIAARIPDHDLPVYSILIALFDEAAVLPDLIAALGRLDYPAAKLDCLLIIEDVDAATKLAFLGSALPAWMRIVIVPEGAPRTKPRALNYALQLARGDYIVVYDAEDRPEADQLRSAITAFQTGGPDLACVQACLNIFNSRQSWLTRQFTIEYSALFDALLPALQRLRVPIPLGGTSNHFPGIA